MTGVSVPGASNIGGSSAFRAPVSGGPVPANSAVPTISGTASVGETLTATTGTWTNAPSSYSYVWKRAGTTISGTVGNTCVVPANATTETITVEVTAINGSGASIPAASSATSTVAATYVPALVTTLQRGVWSPCQVLVSGYSGALIDIDMDGVTKTCSPTSKGLLDIPDIITWWEARASYTGYNGNMPRVSKIYNQGTETTAHLVQATDQNRPILDLNLVQPDGTIPVSFNGYNGRTTDTSGAALAVVEANNNMACATTTLTFNTANHGVLMVAEGIGNIGVAASGSPSQNALVGMNTATTTNRFTLAAGNSSWSSNYGLRAWSGTTVDGPATPLEIPLNRVLLMETQTTNAANVIDGVTPSGTDAVINLRVNNDVASQHTAASSVARASGSGSSGGFHVGRTGAGAAQTGAAFGLYGLIYTSNVLVTSTDGDQRDGISNGMMKALRVPTGHTTNVAVFGSSSVAGYRGNAGMGIPSQIVRSLGTKVRGAVYGVAGSGNANHDTNKVLLSGRKRSGVYNIAIHYNARNDLGTGALTGAATWALVTPFLDQLYADGWDKIVVCTLVASVTAGAPSQATYDAERAAYNALVMNSSEQAAHHFIGVDTAALAEFADYNDYTYYDDQIHQRASTGTPAFAAAVVAAVAPFVA